MATAPVQPSETDWGYFCDYRISEAAWMVMRPACKICDHSPRTSAYEHERQGRFRRTASTDGTGSGQGFTFLLQAGHCPLSFKISPEISSLIFAPSYAFTVTAVGKRLVDFFVGYLVRMFAAQPEVGGVGMNPMRWWP
jgi:hypothetical protein